MKLMRDYLSKLIENLNYAHDHTHAGLLIQRGLTQWEDGEKPIKNQLIADIASIKPDDLYLLAFNRWFNATYDKTNFATICAKIDGRLFTGLPLGGTLETGATTHHTYGMPMIAGSSIKGAVRHYAEYLFSLHKDEKNQQVLDILFGKDSDDENADAGYLIWHDAWWIPQITGDGTLTNGNNINQPFAQEIVTVHHQKYYHGELSKALDIENPIPNQQIAIQGSFYFVIEGDKDWANYAKQLLEKMLSEKNIGAKGSNGYGYFVADDKILKPYLQAFEQQKQQAEQALKAEALKQATVNLNDNQKLIYLFKNELEKLPVNQWQGKPNVTIDIKINGENLWFASLFSKVATWHDDDQKYALEQLFLTELPKLLGTPISKNKNWKGRINPLKSKLNLK